MSFPLLTDEQIDSLHCTSEVYEYHPGAVRELLRYVESAVRAPLLAEIERLTAELAAARESLGQVPHGYAIVPVEPTPEMVSAGRWSGSGDVSVSEDWARREVWARMVAARGEKAQADPRRGA